MKCPHCLVTIHGGFNNTGFVSAGRGSWMMQYMTCPACDEAITNVRERSSPVVYPAYPPNPTQRPLPPEVPNPFKKDFDEAVAVLSISPKASAALSRRTLQAILRDVAKTTKKDLFDQIGEVIESGKMPSHISDGLHAVRHIGNFAAHETKSKVTGEIVDVEPGEAEWNLDVLESLFDFYFVEPAKTAKRKVELNMKLKAAGKPELK